MENPQIKYIKEVLLPEIVSKFENETILDFKIDYSGGLDGFMSALYNITLKTKCKQEKETIKERNIIAKFMKGDETFRESSKSYIQFANEICIYDKVLPAYDALLKEAKITDVSVKDWVAYCYAAKFGYIEGLSTEVSSHESVLVLENLKLLGYTMGPRVYLSRDHLLLMAKTLGQYHSMSYVLRYHNEAKFEALREQIISLPFVEACEPVGAKPNLYAVLHRISFDRFFEYFERLKVQNTFDKNNSDDNKLLENMENLRKKYFEKPAALLEHFRTSIEENEQDRRFGVFVHGDFNRNNVMFLYQNEQKEGNTNADRVQDVKMIDFQELRFGSPAVDVSFFMYFNTSAKLRAEIWMDMLKVYHSEMFKMLEKTLLGLKTETAETNLSKVLEQFSFDKFYKHFSRFAFYGVMICVQYLPWILCSEEECREVSHYFETDMHSEEFYKVSMTIGGDDANKCILDIVRHASKMGYMDFL